MTNIFPNWEEIFEAKGILKITPLIVCLRLAILTVGLIACTFH